MTSRESFPDAVIVVHPSGVEIVEAACLLGRGVFSLKHHNPAQFRRAEFIDGKWTIRVESKR